jgi:phosphodiesterase/alkaline phosphatase D-like protein
MRRLSLLIGALAVTMLALAGQAWAASPTATTGAATDVTSTTATLNATVNLAGGTLVPGVGCYFEYGTSTSYLSVPATCSPTPSGSTNVQVSAAVTGLTASTPYDFQVVLTTLQTLIPTVTDGGNQTFTTQASGSGSGGSGSSPTATTEAASAVTSTTATLNGTVNPGGEPLTACSFNYSSNPALVLLGQGTPANCSSTPTGDTAQAVSADITGLTASTTYYYELTATNAAGSSTPGTPTSFTTTASSGSTPTATTSAATSVTGTSATLNGTVNPAGGTVTSCTFQYGTSTSYGSTATCSPTPSGSSSQSVSASVSGLTANTEYHFRVVLVTSGGTADGNDETFTAQTPPAVDTAQATNVAATSATMNGTVNPNGQTIKTCGFYYGTGASGGFSASQPCSPSTITGSTAQAESANVSGLSPNTTYHYVIAVTTASGETAGSVMTFTTAAGSTGAGTPTAATESATAVTSGAATVHGTANPAGSSVEACEFEYSASPLPATSLGSGAYAPCATTPSGTSSQPVSAQLSGLSAGHTYYYRLLFKTTGGVAVGSILTFTTSGRTAAAKPGVKISRSSVSAKKRTATFKFTATGGQATRYQCALVTVKRGKAGKGHWQGCRSPKTYKKLAKTTYLFEVRAGNSSGYGKARTHRFTI